MSIEFETIHADEKNVEQVIRDPEEVKAIIIPIEKFVSVPKLRQSPPPKPDE